MIDSMPESQSTTAGPPPSTSSDEGAGGSLKQLATRGLLWTMLGFGGGQVLRFGFNLILTHLLFPELFGLMALVYTIVTGLNLFCDAGLGATVVRDPRGGEPAFLNTAWTLQIIRGFGLAFFCVLVAWPAASFYADRRLLWILPVIGLSSIVSGFNSTSLFTCQRRMLVHRMVILELGAQILSGAIMVIWAWL